MTGCAHGAKQECEEVFNRPACLLAGSNPAPVTSRSATTERLVPNRYIDVGGAGRELVGKELYSGGDIRRV